MCLDEPGTARSAVKVISKPPFAQNQRDVHATTTGHPPSWRTVFITAGGGWVTQRCPLNTNCLQALHDGVTQYTFTPPYPLSWLGIQTTLGGAKHYPQCYTTYPDKERCPAVVAHRSLKAIDQYWKMRVKKKHWRIREWSLLFTLPNYIYQQWLPHSNVSQFWYWIGYFLVLLCGQPGKNTVFVYWTLQTNVHRTLVDVFAIAGP